VLPRRAGARSVQAAGVVRVLAVGDRGEPVASNDLVGDPGEELVLAVEAPVGTVGPVCRVVPLVGRHLDDGGADEGGDVVRIRPFVGCEARRDAEDRDDLLGPGHLDGQGEEQRGVHPAGERDAEPLHFRQHSQGSTTSGKSALNS